MGYNTTKLSTGSTINAKTAGIGAIQSGSRLGFKGTEDLGGGLKASFWLEAALGPDTGRGSGSFGNGTTTVNLPGGGSVTTVIIDHEVTLIAGETHRLLVRTTDGLVEATVTASSSKVSPAAMRKASAGLCTAITKMRF
jgi:hypothetical protein